ncbi:MAG: hypothetical protein MUF02_01055 [Acidobacteria bacterium]|nr:hypothetical protein [Acidobacteriota bacterium]
MSTERCETTAMRSSGAAASRRWKARVRALTAASDSPPGKDMRSGSSSQRRHSSGSSAAISVFRRPAQRPRSRLLTSSCISTARPGKQMAAVCAARCRGEEKTRWTSRAAKRTPSSLACLIPAGLSGTSLRPRKTPSRLACVSPWRMK